jgi:hypothetical protein
MYLFAFSALLFAFIATPTVAPGAGFIQPRYVISIFSGATCIALLARSNQNKQNSYNVTSENHIINKIKNVVFFLFGKSLLILASQFSLLFYQVRFGNGLDVRQNDYFSLIQTWSSSFNFIGTRYIAFEGPDLSNFYSPFFNTPAFLVVSQFLVFVCVAVLAWNYNQSRGKVEDVPIATR